MSNVFAQLNNTKGRITINGLDVAIENPAYTYRKSTDKTGQQWSCLMQAHYGYINGYKGNDGDNVDVFVGSIPENDTAYIINQKTQGGFFDEHKVMLGFLSQQQAVDTYQHCFERGWTGLMSVVPCTMSQLKWWLANGDKTRPVAKERLPYAGLERLDSVVWGGTDDANLYSHGGQLSKLLYQIRLDDANNQALEPLAYHDMIAELGNQGFMYENYDALIVEYNKLERKAKQLLMVMQGAASTVKPVGVTVSKPLTKNGVSNVIAWFEMDDGQAVGVFFHNPDKNPKKLDPTDEMISYKWVLNKKDITIAVAPENGKDVIIRTVAKRIMLLVEKNHDRFAKANSDKAELNQKEQSLGQLVIEKQSQLDALNDDIKALEAKKAEKEANNVPTAEELTKQGFDGIATELKKLGWTDDLVMGGLTKSFVGAKESGSVNEDGVLIVNVFRKNSLIGAKVGADTLIPNSVDNIPQYGLNAQTEQSYKKVADKVNNAVDAYVEQRKVELAINGKSTLSANQSTVVKRKPVSVFVYWSESSLFTDNTSYPFAEFEALAFAAAMKNTEGGYDKTKVKVTFDDGFVYGDIRVDLNTKETGFKSLVKSTLDYYKAKNIVNEDQQQLSTFDFSGVNPVVPVQSTIEPVAQVVEPTTQDRPSNWRTNLANARAVAKSLGLETKGKKLERLVMDIDKAEALPNRDELDPTKLAELGVATITSIGHAENIYIEKDGKQYFSKVGNPQLYAEGEWDFAKYPDGKPVNEPVVQTGARYESPKELFLKKANKAYKDLEDNGLKGFAKRANDVVQDVASNIVSLEDAEKRLNGIVYESENPLMSGEWRDLGDRKAYYWEDRRYGEIVDTRKTEGRSKDVSNPWRTGDGKLFESLPVAKKHELEAVSKYKFINDGYMQKTKSSETQQPVSEPPMTDFAFVTFNAWKKGGKHRIYLKVSENDNAFNEMDYGANDLGYLEVVGKNGGEKINNLSTVSNYSKLKDKVIGSAFVDALQEYLSQKDIDITEFNVATLKVKIKSDADVLTEKQAAIDAQANAESQAKQAQQDKTDLQQATIKENIDKFGRDVVVNDLSDAVLGNKAKVEAILAGALMSDKDFNSFLSYQASAVPIAAPNPDRDYLQSIIDGEDTGLAPKEITAKIREIILRAKDARDTDILELADKAAKAYAAHVKAKAVAKLAEVQ